MTGYVDIMSSSVQILYINKHTGIQILKFYYVDCSFVAIGQGKSDGIQDLGPVNWKLALCYMAAFIFVILTLSKSIKTSGKVIYLPCFLWVISLLYIKDMALN